VFDAYGLMKSKVLNNEIETNLRIQFLKYGVRWFNIRSGAYLFLPNGPATPLKLDQPNIVIIDGPLMSSIATGLPFALHECIFTDNVTNMEIRNTVDIRKMGNTEIVMRIDTQIASGNLFYTDLNGLQMIKRERYEKIPLQGNFYPVASVMFIEDSIMRLTVLSAQPLGGSSLRSGQVSMKNEKFT
jgi:alpha-mannosidase II